MTITPHDCFCCGEHVPFNPFQGTAFEPLSLEPVCWDCLEHVNFAGKVLSRCDRFGLRHPTYEEIHGTTGTDDL